MKSSAQFAVEFKYRIGTLASFIVGFVAIILCPLNKCF